MKIKIPDEIAEQAGLDSTEMREFLAVSLYKAVRLSPGGAGEIAGRSRIEFYELLEKYDEYVNYDMDDLLADIETLKNLNL